MTANFIRGSSGFSSQTTCTGLWGKGRYFILPGPNANPSLNPTTLPVPMWLWQTVNQEVANTRGTNWSVVFITTAHTGHMGQLTRGGSSLGEKPWKHNINGHKTQRGFGLSWKDQAITKAFFFKSNPFTFNPTHNNTHSMLGVNVATGLLSPSDEEKHLSWLWILPLLHKIVSKI